MQYRHEYSRDRFCSEWGWKRDYYPFALRCGWNNDGVRFEIDVEHPITAKPPPSPGVHSSKYKE